MLVSVRGSAPGVTKLSTMIAVRPRSDESQALHPDDPADLHCTLCFLGDYPGDLADLAGCLAQVAAGHAPLEGAVSGVGVFADNGKGHPQILLPSAPGLTELRVAVTQALAAAGVDYSRQFGFHPHMTVGYSETPDPPGTEMVGAPLHFDAICIVRGNEEETLVPLTGVKPLTASLAVVATSDKGEEIGAVAEAHSEGCLPDYGDCYWHAADGKVFWIVADYTSNDEIDAGVAAFEQVEGVLEVEACDECAAPAGDGWERVFGWSAESAQERSGARAGGERASTALNPPETLLRAPRSTFATRWKPAPALRASVPAVTAQYHNRVVEAARARADELEPRLAALLEPIFYAAGDDAARTFTARTTVTAGAAWSPPGGDELIDVPALAATLRTKTDPVRLAAIESTMGATLEPHGLSFDVTNPFTEQVLAQSGSQVTAIAETTRANIMRSVREAYDQGLSIPDTAKLIRAGMRDATPARATLIARTELAGAVNGGSLAATRIVEEEIGVAFNKQWLTAPGAIYPRHELYEGLNGQTTALDGTFDVGGYDLGFPGDPDGPPEEVCNCRCALAYVEAGSVPQSGPSEEYQPTGEEVGALNAYTSNSYKDINASLREDKPLDTFQQNIVTNIDHVFEKSPTYFSVPIKMHRAIHDSASRIFGTDNPSSLIGQRITDKGFMSGSLEPFDMSDWVTKDSAAVTIDVPTTTKALYLPAIDGTKIGEEEEILLARNTTLEVTDASRNEQGVWEVRARVVNDLPAEPIPPMTEGETAPVVVSSDEFDRQMEKVDATPLFRGLHGKNAAAAADATRAGESGGGGDYGKGTYLSQAWEHASGYAQSHGGDQTGVVMRGFLRPDAKTATPADMPKDIRHPADWAAENGYDAWASDANYVVVVNPEAMVWDSKNYTAKEIARVETARRYPEPVAPLRATEEGARAWIAAANEDPPYLALPAFQQFDGVGAFDGIEPQEVPLNSDLVATEGGHVDWGYKPEDAGAPIDVVRYQGKLYVVDGHHRVTWALREGEQTINARVIDADLPAPSPPGAPLLPPSSDQQLLSLVEQAEARPKAHLTEGTLSTQTARTRKLLRELLAKQATTGLTPKELERLDYHEEKLRQLLREKEIRSGTPQREFAHWTNEHLDREVASQREVLGLAPADIDPSILAAGRERLRALAKEQDYRRTHPKARIPEAGTLTPASIELPPPSNERVARLRAAAQRFGADTRRAGGLADPLATFEELQAAEQEMTALGADIRAEIQSRLPFTRRDTLADRDLPSQMRRKAFSDVMAEIRPMGKIDPSASGFKKITGAAAPRTDIEKALGFYPQDWVAKAKDQTLRLKAKSRGYFLQGDERFGEPNEIAVSSRYTSVPGDSPLFSTALHEVGHLMEFNVPAIRAAESAFYARRTEGDLVRLYPGKKDEFYRQDEWTHPYMGRDYGVSIFEVGEEGPQPAPGSYYELLTMGMEALVSGRYALDDDMTNFILGLLATV